MSYKIVAIKNMSAGNDSVGEMWNETKIFDSFEPVENIIKWGFGPTAGKNGEIYYSRKNLILTVPEQEHK